MAEGEIWANVRWAADAILSGGRVVIVDSDPIQTLKIQVMVFDPSPAPPSSTPGNAPWAPR